MDQIIDPRNIGAQHTRAKIRSRERRCEMFVIKFVQSQCYGILSGRGYREQYAGTSEIVPVARYFDGQQVYLNPSSP